MRSPPLLHTSFVAVDIEATGMDPGRHEIIEIGLQIFDRTGLAERFSTLVRPKGRLSLDITALTGIDERELAAASAFSEVAPQIRRLLAGRAIVGHSVDLDLAMLTAAGLDFSSNDIFDTYHLATLLLSDLPAYNLSAVASALGVTSIDAHRALADAERSATVFLRLLEHLDTYETSTLEEVATYARTAGWRLAPLFTDALRFASTRSERVDATRERRFVSEFGFLTDRERPEPLRPTGSRSAIPSDAIQRALRQDGPIASVLSGYEHRPQQEQMAHAVAEAFNHSGQLLVEAGTGTGKSVAYLLPAVLHATETGESVVISTNTLALQDQLYRKDIPDLRAALRSTEQMAEFDAVVLKGRTNYLCLRRWFAEHRQPTFDPVDAGLRAKILLWLGQTETGDRAELRLDAEEGQRWRALSEEEEGCVAAHCVYQQRNQCFLYRARRAADQAHLVVVNHSLLLSDVTAGSRVLPAYNRLIIDEAHHLEEQATTHFGFNVDQRSIEDLLDRITKLDGALFSGAIAVAVAYLRAHLDPDDLRTRERGEPPEQREKLAFGAAANARSATLELFALFTEFTVRYGAAEGGFDRTVRVTDGVRHDGAWLHVELTWERLDANLRELYEQLRWFLDTVDRPAMAARADELVEDQRDALIGQLTTLARDLAKIAVELLQIIGSPDRNAVYWLERHSLTGHITLHAAPLAVDELLRDKLYDTLDTVILTSATITTDGSFDYVAERLGLSDADRVAVPSPFDYQRSTLLYIADDMPEPNQPGYQRRVQDALMGVCGASRGRALVLFTSHAALQATYKAIKRPLEDEGILVLAQRTDGNPRQLIERLRHTPNVVLLGTASFWEGVDVVGPALSVLVITKLPFSVPSDPVFAARSEMLDEPFLDYAVPQAVLKFKQGFGRLIRSSHDRGVCVILDRRVLSKRYGASFVQSLPECAE
ncbi:MAG: DEAD/DEAH box helicase family protein, partial [Chloroflexia bacterium]|nr:DEAD/DEAH box helicase family protein [Chloroflexia bacterium]